MAKILITGSADGLGLLAAKALIQGGHQVVLHARNEERKKQALKNAPGAAGILVADLSSMAETKRFAELANALGAFDAVIHNAGVYQVPKNSVGEEGLPLLLTVNSLAPYILTCLMHKPKRLVYLSSGMHMQGSTNVETLHVTYSDTKLHDLILAKAFAAKWPDVYANAVDPGWVATKMGGAGAPDSLEKGFETQVWLAVSNDAEALVSGRYFHHKREARYHHAADHPTIREKLLNHFEQVTGIAFGEISG